MTENTNGEQPMPISMSGLLRIVAKQQEGLKTSLSKDFFSCPGSGRNIISSVSVCGALATHHEAFDSCILPG